MRNKFILVFLINLICFLQVQGQTTDAPEQNCIGGIPVCRPVYHQTNSYIGYGTVQELFSGNYDCDPFDGEVNSVWYIINVISPGNLEFKITPNHLTDDYDWCMWDITDSGCSSIFNYTTGTPNTYSSVRCNASGNTGITGLDPTATLPKEGPGGTPNMSTLLPVTAGRTYALVILNWSRSTYGYTLDFSSSTASIYDTVRPVFKSIKVGGCNFPNDTLYVGMSVPIECNSLDPDGSDFYVTPSVPGLSVTSAFNSVCQAGGSISNNFTLHLSKALPPGNYALHVRVGNDTNTLVDNCVNQQSTTDSISFTVYKNYHFTDTTICGGDTLFPGIVLPNPDSPASVAWSPGTYMNNPGIAHPRAIPSNDIMYVATITQILSGHTCVAIDTDHVTVLKWYTLGNKDTAICDGIAIHAEMNYDWRYKYAWKPNKWVTDTSIANPVFKPDSNVTYTVTASYPGCKDSSSSFSVRIIPVPDTFSLFAPTILCRGDAVQLNSKPDTNFNFIWSTGSTNCCISVTDSGLYTLKKYTVCGFEQASILINTYPCDSCIWVPSAFSPNGDGRNDKFHVFKRCPLKQYYLEVLDRYGQIVFQSFDFENQWDGKVHGVPADVGTYYYLIKYILEKPGSPERYIKGDVTLIK